jgi:hypothetical protein
MAMDVAMVVAVEVAAEMAIYDDLIVAVEVA